MTLPLLALSVFPIEAAALWSHVSASTPSCRVQPTCCPGRIRTSSSPTHIRGSAVGFATAMTRIGATAGTFLLPILLESIGTRPTMLVGAAVVAAGLVMCVLWAPETSGRSLDEASSMAASPPGQRNTLEQDRTETA